MVALAFVPVGGELADGAILGARLAEGADEALTLTRGAEEADSAGSALLKSCRLNSFTASTLVLMADGTSKPIDQIHVGDTVQATDPTTGKTSTQPVTAVMVHHDTDLLDLTIQADGVTSLIHTTDHHPFWDDTTHTWTDAGRLTPGDHLHTDDGTTATVIVIATAVLPGSGDMWDLTINHTHTFYVLTTNAGTLRREYPSHTDDGGTTNGTAVGVGILVHNACLPELRNWSSQRFQFGQAQFQLDKKGLTHILERHHLDYWDGSVKARQTFFDSSMSIDDVQAAIGEVARQNRTQLMRIGSGIDQIQGAVGGVDYVLGVSRGRIGQFFPGTLP
ncbi:polymorphic toxin-type HINT domain-containing protein [Pseudofrankia sp. DC12]|uniref:polymorphic toxin-type HINT domain-containing protein n=1 Tax=Pseudofrankia sp. DC12 TaxID=683315 RepID=UPI0005F79A6D|nr:polymorphic toxin-type HINT domain-containing protein [Pseudofrankia sp. DC12]